MTHVFTPRRSGALLALLTAVLVLSLSATAPAAISRAQQAARAASQASFFCFAWDCSSKTRTAAVFINGTLRTTWRLNHPHSIFSHGNCRTVAVMAINVTSGGAVTSRLVACR